MQTTSAEATGIPAGLPAAKDGYRTSPDQETTGWPPGVRYIIGNEACERFSYYGMRAILATHLASLYMLHQHLGKNEADAAATGATHLFFAAVYALPMIGAILAERLLGKYRTIFYLSLVYCAGNAALALGSGYLEGMFLGLALIAIGAGGIKPCVSANVGDQFGKGNWFRVRTIYQVFYFSINLGSACATLLIPQLQTHFGTAVAFGVPGVLMFIATVIFWMGRRKFVHVPPRPGGRLGLFDVASSTLLFMTVGHVFITPLLIAPAGLRWAGFSVESLPFLAVLGVVSLMFLAAGLFLFGKRQQVAQDDGFLAILWYAWKHRGKRAAAEGDGPASESWLARSPFWGPAVDRFGLKATEGPVAVFKILSVFVLISIFWALFDQHSSSWIFQAGKMDLRLWGDRDSLLGIDNVTLNKNQVPALNPLMIMVFIPVMNLVYRRLDRAGVSTTPLRRMTVGMFFATLSFAAVAVLQQRIDANSRDGLPAVWFGWQIIPYLIMTVAEVMVSITGLEFAYTQAPARMKSTIMGFWLLSVSLGNVLVTFVAGIPGLEPVHFFWIFTGLGAAGGVLLGLRAYFYVQKDYAQE
jgi:POT family proton-dependent oligopeptide transporter